MDDMTRTQLIVAVDDEPSILSSLRRALRPTGADFAAFESPELALAAFATREPDLIISDMRMPGMDGAEFLAKAKKMHPWAMRILLTGHADHDRSIKALNEGGVWRHLTKPWNDVELLACVSGALEMRRMSREKARLERVTREQRDELAALNKDLEKKVAERTAKLDANFATLVKVLSGIVDARFADGRAKRIASIARAAAVQLNMSKSECDVVQRAALLHLIGKVASPDGLLSLEDSEATHRQTQAMRAYPVDGEELLMALEDLRPEAAIIRSHCERVDGSGHPDGLSGEHIPLGARILGAAVAFDDIVGSGGLADPLTAMAAGGELRRWAGTRLCPKSCDAILAAFCIQPAEYPHAPLAKKPAVDVASIMVDCRHLLAGMVLARDAQAPSGALLLAAGQTVTPAIIAQLQRFEDRHGAHLRFHVVACDQ